LLSLPAGSNTIRSLTSSYISELKAKRPGDPFAAELYRVLLAPVVKAFPQSRFIISPDGVLYSVPFEALRDEQGFFVRSRVVSYTPSGTVLWRIRNKRFQESARPLLAVGAVDYKLARALPKSFAHDTVAAAAVRGLAELSGSRLEDLPASRDEVLAIAQIAGPHTQLLLGQSATETGFKTQPLAEFRVIHLATHAAADPQYPDRAALILGVAHNTQDDGLLQVREIMGLSLNADLVTLSACDTNVGIDQREAGVVNLEQAFLIAGARAVVASLWNVEDRSTTALMKAFYTHLAQHEDKALALAHAKRDMLEHYGDPSPYYWAAFVLVGEGAQPVSFGR
jgi:CHAT domain-containing protein